MFARIKKSSHRLTAGLLVVAVLALGWGMADAADAGAGGEAPAVVRQIKVLPDKAPDCSSLKSIAETVTRGCNTNDAKGVALYNFVLLTHYHYFSANEAGGIPALKEINCYYGWGLCEARYENRWHYFDPFLKWYVWMPDGKDTAQDPDGDVIVPPERGADTADPPLEYSIDVTKSVKSWLAGDARNQGLVPMIDRSVDDGQMTRLQLYASEHNQTEFTPKLVIRLTR
jgi:hypothetical protein